MALIKATSLVTARLLPYEGYIDNEHDFVEKTWWAHHRGIGERRRLPSPGVVRAGEPLPSWTVKSDEDDFAALVASPGQEIEVDDLFEKALYVHDADSARLIIVDENGAREDWVGRRLLHRRKIAVVPIGASRAKVKLHMTVFDIPRKACRCFFSLGDIHAATGYRSRCRRPPSKWVHDRLPVLENLMLRLSVLGGYTKSMRYTKREPAVIEINETPAAPIRLPTIEKAEGAYDEERILLYIAGDTVASLTHLATAAFAKQALGGCKDPELRQANKDLLEALLRGLEGMPWALTVMVT